MFSKNEDLRPTQPSPPLISWKYVKDKMHWGLIFLMGGGFALAEGIKSSGMDDLVSENLSTLADLPPLVILIVCSLLAMFVTQFTSNAAVANILLPIVSSIAKVSLIFYL